MRILSVGQVCDFERGGIVNQIRLRLDDGSEAVIQTDEQTVTQILDLATSALRSERSPRVEEPEPDIGERASMEPMPDLPDLAGDAEWADESVPPPEPEKPKRPGRIAPHHTVSRIPARTVPQDEAGNPIVPKATFRRPLDDDDGVSI